MSHTATQSSHLSRVVERQMRNWELARRQGPRDGRKHPEVEDFIALSRQVGVDDREVIEEVGRRRGWPVFDRQLLDVMAGDDEVRRRLYATMDQRDLSWGEEVLRTLLLPGALRNDYFHRLCDTVLALARQGSCIFVGRGVDLILPRDRGLRVRLVSDREARIAHLAKAQGLSPEAAEKEVHRVERERADFIRRHFGSEDNEPARWDLALCLDRRPAAWAVETILAAGG